MIKHYSFSTNKIAELDSDDDKEEDEIENVTSPFSEKSSLDPLHSPLEGNCCVSNELEQITTNVDEENTHESVVVSLPLLPQGKLGTVSVDMNCTELDLTRPNGDEETSIEDGSLSSSNLSLAPIRVNRNDTRRPPERTPAEIELDYNKKNKNKKLRKLLRCHGLVLFCTLFILSVATIPCLLFQEIKDLSLPILPSIISLTLVISWGVHVYLYFAQDDVKIQFEQRRNEILRNNP
ncbi:MULTISPECIES: hypothetical protein [Candidatus Ichthyocystis]|uniref:Putative membrane protein n=1 Tax=Candidatus Ichthyocystis hellenicum TaxID=1561003 RepID=A0A0S4M3G7_9BURK|nr:MULTISPECIES: hypothetical protein [Ichthyocystis]CUT18311.1 putative membrane protein [Candidatus Ichthyocystis hellenicum]